MRKLSILLTIAAALGCATLVVSAAPPPVTTYVPAAVYCYKPAITPIAGSLLCPVLPGDIGPDPALNAKTFGYQGITDTSLPTNFNTDVESPFDNLSWQTFVALNWTAGKTNKPAAEGLKGDGPRVWQGWDRVAQVFGNSPIQANCQSNPGEQYFSIASNGNGTPAVRNEEYIQAATGDPAIDVNGNWTLYERRLNGIETAYLRAPNGNRQWDLTTAQGQGAFVEAQNTVNFPAKSATAPNGAMEIKAAWRILDPAKHAANAKRFFVVKAMLAVSPELVAKNGTPYAPPICAHVELGLVAMHIIQKNPLTTNKLLPQWFWSTFEHVDNAPPASPACDVTAPGNCKIVNQQACPTTLSGPQPDYSYFNVNTQDLATNQPPQLQPKGKAFLWNQTQPYAKLYLRKARNGTMAGTQITRCWHIYKLTKQLNDQWRAQLKAVNSVFANYHLIGTQWGAAVETTNPLTFPPGAVPPFLSNTLLETYIQTFFPPGNGFGTGSCIACHAGANLTTNQAVLTNFSFLPGLVNPILTRRAPIPPGGKP